MTVLYVLISTDYYGGATKSFMKLLKGVISAGINAMVVVPDTNGIYPILCKMGLKVFVVSSKSNTWTGAKTFKQKILYIPRQFGRILVNLRAHKKIDNIIRNEEIDIVHSNNTVTDLGRHIAESRNIPHLYHVREYGDKDFGLRYFPTTRSFHNYLRQSNVYTVCITKDIQIHHGLMNNHNSKVIYNGIIDDIYEVNTNNDVRNYFLYAGRIEPTKGLLELIKAYSIYVKQVSNPLPLKVAGEVFDFNYKKNIDELIQKNNLINNIDFLGTCNDMSAMYKNAKAIVICSEYEGFGRCMPEAMSYGCIVIGHNTGGIKEQFDNGLSLTGTEIGYRYDNREELIYTLLEVHNLHAEAYAFMQRKAFQVVEKLYSVSNYVQSILDFYELIKERQKK